MNYLMVHYIHMYMCRQTFYLYNVHILLHSTKTDCSSYYTVVYVLAIV